MKILPFMANIYHVYVYTFSACFKNICHQHHCMLCTLHDTSMQCVNGSFQC